MSQQKKGSCGHFLAVWDPHTDCAGCRDCCNLDTPCTVCDAMAPELKERTLRARVRRLKRLARRAGSGGTNSGSSHRSTPGPLETLSDTSGPKPTPSAQGRKGGENVSPAPDGARDGDICCVASSPLASLDGRGSRKRPASQPRLLEGGPSSKVRVSLPPSGSQDVDPILVGVSPRPKRPRDGDHLSVSPHLKRSRDGDHHSVSPCPERSRDGDHGVRVSPRPERSRDGDRPSVRPSSGREPEKDNLLSSPEDQEGASPWADENWIRRQAHRLRSRSPAGRQHRRRSHSSEGTAADDESPYCPSPTRSVSPAVHVHGDWFTGPSITEVKTSGPVRLRGVTRRKGQGGRRSPATTRPSRADRRHDSFRRRRHGMYPDSQSSDCSSEGRRDAPSRERRHVYGRERYRDERPVLAEEERQSMMTLVADLQRRLVAIERKPATSAPSSPDPQEEMEIVDLPLEAADDFSSEEEVGDGRAQGAPTTREVQPCDPVFLDTPRARVPVTSTITSASSLEDFANDEPEWRMYRETIKSVYRYNLAIAPYTVPMKEMFGGDLVLRRPRTGREERFLSLPQSEVLTRAIQYVNSILRGGQVGQAEDGGRVRESAQRWGANMSLTHPPIRQFKSEFYRIHHDPSLPEGERLQPHIPWTTTDATLVSKKGYPAEFRVRASQLKDCEMLQRAGLGMTNHLDWFISTIWRVLDQAQLAEETKAELDGLLTSSLVSVNQTAHVFARLLASNATTRREGILDSSVLDRASELVLRGQPIGGADLLGGRCAEFVQRAAEETQKSLLFQAALGRSGQPKGTGVSRGSFKTQRRPRPPKKSRQGQAPPSLPGAPKQRPQMGPPTSRRVSRGRGRQLGVTTTWSTKPYKV